MTQPKTLTVEQTEILARANEVEDALPTLPSITPVAPCGLKPADTAARQLKLSCENMLSAMNAGHTEWTRLATSMRNAAKAYGDVDESGAQALTSEGDAAIGESGSLADGVQSSAQVNDTQVAAGGADFNDLKTAAQLVEKPDQAVSLRNFASKWIDYNLTLQELVTRFRGFQSWDGEAAAAVVASMDQQTQWVQFMAKLSVSMAKQAQFVADLHAWAYAKHPRYADVVGLEKAYASTEDPYMRQKIMNEYATLQSASNEVVDKYTSQGTLEPINPPKPPEAVKIAAPGPQGLIPGQIMSVIGAGGGQGGMPQMPTMPSTGGGSGGSGMPSGSEATLAGAGRHEAPKAPSLGGAGGMKPMSVGGLGGAPSMPLAPPVDAGAAGDSVRPAGTTDLAGAGRGGSASGSGMAGGGMGAPMGAGGQGQGSSKSKSSQQDDEALYKEDRAWTEAVIGNRPRRPDGKESK